MNEPAKDSEPAFAYTTGETGDVIRFYYVHRRPNPPAWEARVIATSTAEAVQLQSLKDFKLYAWRPLRDHKQLVQVYYRGVEVLPSDARSLLQLELKIAGFMDNGDDGSLERVAGDVLVDELNVPRQALVAKMLGR